MVKRCVLVCTPNWCKNKHSCLLWRLWCYLKTKGPIQVHCDLGMENKSAHQIWPSWEPSVYWVLNPRKIHGDICFLITSEREYCVSGRQVTSWWLCSKGKIMWAGQTGMGKGPRPQPAQAPPPKGGREAYLPWKWCRPFLLLGWKNSQEL